MLVFFVSALFFFSSHAIIKISILDTGFCLDKVTTHSKNIKILPPIDLTGSLNEAQCKNIDINTKRRYHGQLVLNTFLANLNTSEEVLITAYIIFDKNKSQKEAYWEKAFDKEIQKNTDIYLVAAGLPYLGRIALEDKKITSYAFLASGVSDQIISKEHKLWPQSERLKNDNLFIIGDNYPKTKFDTKYLSKKILNKDSIDYFFDYKGENPEFSGSSYSVAVALGRAVSLCAKELSSLRNCLEKSREEIKWRESIKGFTF